MNRSFSPDELKTFDGKEGRRAYIAYKEVVYDVTDSPLWKNGMHMRMHAAGQDLTQMLRKAPHAEEVFDNFPKIGILADSVESETMSPPEVKPDTKESLRQWNKKFHPHPMSVHFPIALHYFSAFFNLVFLIFPSYEYEFAVYSSFFGATVMGLFALGAGVFSWWVKYNFERSNAFMIKLSGAVTTLILGIVPIALRMENPLVAYSKGIDGIVYHSIIFVTALIVTIVAYYGGKITWGGK